MATNMTEAMGALSILSQVGGAAYDQALQRFYGSGRTSPCDEQVVRPAGHIAGPGNARGVKDLTAHPLFSIKNPNRVRSVYGAFAHGNQVRFNDASGEGYELIASAVIEIDGFNPQIASRLVSAFESWRIFEPKRRALALKRFEARARQKEPLLRCVRDRVEAYWGGEAGRRRLEQRSLRRVIGG